MLAKKSGTPWTGLHISQSYERFIFNSYVFIGPRGRFTRYCVEKGKELPWPVTTVNRDQIPNFIKVEKLYLALS